MSFQSIQYEKSNGVGIITLNRPDVLNAIDDAMTMELQQVLKEAERDEAVRCLVLTGSGRAFCAGQDISGGGLAQPEDSEGFSFIEAVRRRYTPLILRMRRIEKPVIGAINGVAAGAGCSLALATDIRYCSDKASFIQAFVRIGLVPDSGSTWFLPRLIGMAKAAEMIFTGDKIEAGEAERIGLVNRVVAADDLMAQTLTLAERLAKGPTKAIGLSKRALNRALASDLEEILEYEGYLQEVAGHCGDFMEGVMSFAEKRPPAFTGK